MKYLLSLFFIVIAHMALSQHIVRGMIVDAESNGVVAGATVYINNSTIRTSTGKDGEYALKLPGDGN